MKQPDLWPLARKTTDLPTDEPAVEEDADLDVEEEDEDDEDTLDEDEDEED